MVTQPSMQRISSRRPFVFTSSLALCLLAAGALVVAACSQGEGDRCEVDTDCSGDLVCSPGGICRLRTDTNNMVDAAVDGGAGADATKPTADATLATDTAATDTAVQPDANVAVDLPVATPDAELVAADAARDVHPDVTPDQMPRADAAGTQ